MLESITPETAAAMRVSPKVNFVQTVDFGSINPGTIIRFHTRSGNCYLLEMVVPEPAVIYIFQCERRQGAAEKHLGLMEIFSTSMRIGERLFSRNNQLTFTTSPIDRIAVFI